MSKHEGSNTSPGSMKKSMRSVEMTKNGTPTTLKPIMSATMPTTTELNEVEVNQLRMKVNLLENDVDRRQDSYITREKAYKTRINELEEELSQLRQNKVGVINTERKVEKLKAMQNQIINNVDLVQDRTSRILQEQERDLLRAFRARLFDVQSELEKEKSKKDDGTSAWKEKSAKLEAELTWAKEVTDRLEHTNQLLSNENHRLKNLYESQDEDRAFNIRQLVLIKKETAELKSRYELLDKTRLELVEKVHGAEDKEKSVVAARGVNKVESDDKYKEINNRLRKTLESERKSLQKERQSYQQELRARTEAELLLRQCVEDVRREISRVHLQSAREAATAKTGGYDSRKFTSKSADSDMKPSRSGSKDDKLSAEDRERQLELLLSQERVVSLLYSKTFPMTVKPQQTGVGLILEESEANNLTV